MINHLRHMAVFARVVDEGSFRAAAKDLGLAPSRVSETVSDLEEYLGVTLLNRTTRKLFLTHEGRLFYAHVTDMIRNAEAGLNELNVLSLKPVGALQVSMPAFLGSSAISFAIAQFALTYPEVSLSLTYTDHMVDMLSEEIDLSIRVGWLQDSSMMSRKIGESRRLLVAGNKYLEKRVVPKHPDDLKDWDWIRFRMRPNSINFESISGEKISIYDRSRINVDNAEAMAFFARQNLGLAILPAHLADEHVQSGELAYVLPEWELESLGYYAVWPDKSRRENLTLLLVRFLADQGMSASKPDSQ